jgi:hypothetical protein
MKQLNPKDYNLHSRIEILQLSEHKIAIVKKRKSRIIVKDGKQFLEQIAAIKQKHPDHEFALIISGPICSKTLKLMDENGIEVIKE